MKVLVFSWEYPPRVVGGLARHVQELYRSMVKENDDVEVHVITCKTEGQAYEKTYENDMGVNVYRVQSRGPRCDDFVTWVTQLSFSMVGKCMELIMEGFEFDVIHVHDWLAAYAAVTAKHACKIPLVATIHATEWGRNRGLHNDTQRHISDIEWYLSYESWKIIVCSEYMKNEVKGVFGLPDNKVEIVPNGVVPSQFEASVVDDSQEYLFYVGRLVPEKGVQDLLEAFSIVSKGYPKLRLKIAGTGTYKEDLIYLASKLGVSSKVDFLGFVDDETRNKLYAHAVIAVVPSRYEPFGITALEAMAAGTPLISADIGGLDEVVEHSVTGWKFYSGNVNSLKDAITCLLRSPGDREKIADNARRMIEEKYNWKNISADTLRVYEEILDEAYFVKWTGRYENISEDAIPSVY